MNVEREKLAECLILEYSGDSADIDKSTDPGQQVADYRLIDSVSRLMALGLSSEDIIKSNDGQPMIPDVLTPHQSSSMSEIVEETMKAVEATHRVLRSRIEEADMEIKMAMVRKKALARRLDVIQRLRDMLNNEAEKNTAA